MATAKLDILKYLQVKLFWYLDCFLFTIYWFGHTIAIVLKSAIISLIYPC